MAVQWDRGCLPVQAGDIVTAVVAYEHLCQAGPFRGVTQGDFIALLRAIAAKKLLMQDANRLLLHGELGGRLVNHYTFYAAFPDSQEYRLRQWGKERGTLPLSAWNQRGDAITFAGRRWAIEHIDHDKRLVDLHPSSMGKLRPNPAPQRPNYSHAKMCQTLKSETGCCQMNCVWQTMQAGRYT